MSQCYSVIIDRDISAPVHGKEGVNGLNSIDKHYIYQLMSNVRLMGSKHFILVLSFIIAHKTMISVLKNNSKNICLKIIENIESFIRENTKRASKIK